MKKIVSIFMAIIVCLTIIAPCLATEEDFNPTDLPTIEIEE